MPTFQKFRADFQAWVMGTVALTPIKILMVRLLDFPAYLRQSGQGSGCPKSLSSSWESGASGPTRPSPAAWSSWACASETPFRKCNWPGMAARMAPPKGHSPPVTERGRDIRQTVSWKTGGSLEGSFHSSVSLLDFLRLQDSLAHFHLLFLPLTFTAIRLHSNLTTPNLPWLLHYFLSGRNFLQWYFLMFDITLMSCFSEDLDQNRPHVSMTGHCAHMTFYPQVIVVFLLLTPELVEFTCSMTGAFADHTSLIHNAGTLLWIRKIILSVLKLYHHA